jgi:hypothetical protein
MQQTDIGIAPTTLTDDELFRLARTQLYSGTLTESWQHELVARFERLLFKLEKADIV